MADKHRAVIVENAGGEARVFAETLFRCAVDAVQQKLVGAGDYKMLADQSRAEYYVACGVFRKGERHAAGLRAVREHVQNALTGLVDCQHGLHVIAALTDGGDTARNINGVRLDAARPGVHYVKAGRLRFVQPVQKQTAPGRYGVLKIYGIARKLHGAFVVDLAKLDIFRQRRAV